MKASCLALLLLCGVCNTGNAADDNESKTTKQERLELIDRAAKQSYLDALELYRRDIEDKPYDVLLVLERCDFLLEILGRFQEGGPPWTEEVSDESERCESDAAGHFTGHPEILLRQLRSEYGKDGVKAGQKLLENDLSLWTSAQLSRLYSHLANSSNVTDERTAKAYALRALNFDQKADVRLVAAQWLIRDREYERARDVLTSPFDTHGEDNTYYLIQKAKLLAEFDAKDDVLSLYAKINKSKQPVYNRTDLVQALVDVNALDAARAELDKAGSSATWDHRVAFRRFLLEYKAGTPAQALDAYNKLRDQGLETDPILQYRISLLARSATLPWNIRDLIGLGTLLAILLSIGCAATMVVGAVHYRGLVRRFAGRDMESELPSWSLSNAWYALFLILSCSILAMYFVGPLQFDGNGWQWEALLGNRKQLSFSVIAESILQALAAIPLLLAVRSNGTALTTRFIFIKAIWTGALLGLIFRLPSLLLLLASANRTAFTQNAPEIVQIFLDLKQHFGIATVALIAAVAAPVVEEFFFRGVLLGAFSKHLSFRWANALQAAIFAALHLQPSAMPLLFVIGVVAGILVRRSGGLLPSIVMHAVFNALFVVFLLPQI